MHRCPAPAAPAAVLPDGDMCFPQVLEASGRLWGPVLLALFLAASRGKVGKSLGPGEEY